MLVDTECIPLRGTERIESDDMAWACWVGGVGGDDWSEASKLVVLPGGENGLEVALRGVTGGESLYDWVLEAVRAEVVLE